MATSPIRPGIIYPNDFTLINLTLLTSVTTMDMKLMLTELSYNEDLFSNVTSGYLMIVDSQGYIETLQLMGNEFLRMTFGKTNDPVNWIDKIFRVYKVDKRKPESNLNTESYSLYFCSEEQVISEQYKVSKSYKGKAISDNITDIATNYLKIPAKKIGTIEQSHGVYDFIVPVLKPFDAINWFCTYARPTADKVGADMIFYEDKNGFNLRSLQSLMNNPVYVNYNYDPKNVQVKDIQKNVYTALTYEIMDSYDTLHGINYGIFANRLLSVDPLLQRWKITDFNYDTYSQQVSQLNKFQIVNNYQNRLGDMVTDTPQSVTKFAFTNHGQTDSPLIAADPTVVDRDLHTEFFIPYRAAQLGLANYTRIKLSVPGDPGLTVGSVVSFSLLSKTPNNKSLDSFYSGNYLVSAVRHLINTKEYKTVVEIIKDSNTTAYNGVNNTQAIWQNSAKGLT